MDYLVLFRLCFIAIFFGKCVSSDNLSLLLSTSDLFSKNRLFHVSCLDCELEYVFTQQEGKFFCPVFEINKAIYTTIQMHHPQSLTIAIQIVIERVVASESFYSSKFVGRYYSNREKNPWG